MNNLRKSCARDLPTVNGGQFYFLAVVVLDDNMSQSLRAVKRFRLRELVPPPNVIPPTATVAPKLSERLAPEQKLSRSGAVPNPFLPHRNPQSGRWAPPKYSLRRQADLIKHARASGTLHLLPPGPKLSPAAQQQQQLAAATASTDSHSTAADRASEEVKVTGLTNPQPARNSSRDDDDVAWTGSVEWVGNLRERSVAGADVGNRLYAGKKRMFKGHKWERTRERRVTRTKILLRDMDKRVERFKQVRVYALLVTFLLMVPQFPSLTFFFVLLFRIVPCEGQAAAAGKEIKSAEEDPEVAILVSRLTNAFSSTVSHILMETNGVTAVGRFPPVKEC